MTLSSSKPLRRWRSASSGKRPGPVSGTNRITLQRGRTAGEAQLESVIQLVLETGPGRFPLDALRQRLSGFEEDRVIEQVQRLQGSVGDAPPGTGESGIRFVEIRQERIRRGALVVNVQAAAIALLAHRLLPFPAVAVTHFCHSGRLRRLDALAADLRIEQAAGGERLVADQLRRQTEARLA